VNDEEDKMMKKLTLLLTMLLPMTVVSAPDAHDFRAYKGDKHAEMEHVQKMKFAKHGLPKHLEALNLTEQQKTEIDALMNKQLVAEQMDEMWSMRHQITELGMEDEIDQQRFEQLLDKYIDLEQEHLTHKVKTKHAFFNLLDEQQKLTLKQTHSKMKKCKKSPQH